MAQQTAMAYDQVGSIAQGMDTAADVLRTVSKVLEAAIMILKATAFLSFGATKMAEMYLSNIKPRVDTLAETCAEMSGDLSKAIQDHQQADQSAAPTFN